MIEKFITNFKKNYNEYSKYTPLIVGIPSIIGAIWQGIELYSINPIFLRFFSISQLISDGILIIGIIFTFTLVVIVSKIIHKKLGTFYVFNKNSNKSIGFSILMGIMHMLYGSLIIYVYFFKLEIFEKINISNSTFIIFSIFLGIPLIISGFLGAIIYPMLFINKHKSKKILTSILKNSEEGKGIIYNLFLTLIIFLIPIIFSLILFTPLKLRKELISPQTIFNFSKIETKIKSDIRDDIDYEIRYFNDKYMFIEYFTENNKPRVGKIIIYETNDILFNNNCK